MITKIVFRTLMVLAVLEMNMLIYVIRESDFFHFLSRNLRFFFCLLKILFNKILMYLFCRFWTVVHKGIEEKGNKFLFLTLSPFPHLTFLFRGHMNEQDYSVFSPYTKLKDPALINIHTYYLLTSRREVSKDESPTTTQRRNMSFTGKGNCSLRIACIIYECKREHDEKRL